MPHSGVSSLAEPDTSANISMISVSGANYLSQQAALLSAQ